MDPKLLSEVVGNIGLPGAILIYLIWRFDKFLTFLCGKLTTYNAEFRDIFLALNGIVQELKELKISLTDKIKK